MEEKKKKKKKLLLLLLLLLLFTVVFFVSFFWWKRPKNRMSKDELAIAGIIEGKTKEEIEDILNQQVEEGMVNITVNASPIFEYNGEKGALEIQNIPGNHYSFQVSLYLKGSDKALYTSKLIDPGYYINYVKLNKKLKKGKYPAMVVFETYDISGESDEHIAEVKTDVELVVLDGKYYEQ